MQDTAVPGKGQSAVAVALEVTFRDSRAFSFSVWNSAAVSSRCRSNNSHLVPTSIALFFSGPKIWFGFPLSDGASPPYCALVPSNSAPTGFDDVAYAAYTLAIGNGLRTMPRLKFGSP